jgi:hypothetical protein
MNHEDTCENLRLFAKHVMPRLEEYYARARQEAA